ncbi:MAG: hypothetical protein ACREFX_02485, partial [Opitutaceae bacterium]
MPIAPADAQHPAKLCAAVQSGAQPSLILLRSSWLGRAYLGGLVDAAGRLHAWLEIWVQSPGGAALDEREAGTNPEIDARWKRWAAGLVGAEGFFATGWESAHPDPVWLDVANGRAVVPKDAGSGEAYRLCTDDAVLLVAGLGTFSDSGRRFLAVKGRPAAGILAPAGEPAPGARSANEALPGSGAGLLPFNPEGGFIVARRLPPLEWEAYAALLSGKAFSGLAAGRPPVKLGGPYAGLDDWDKLQQSGAYLFPVSRGRAGRFHETFHLKLLLLRSMLREAHAAVAAAQAPLLNLGGGAFRVDLSADSGALPVLWTARAVLAEPAGAVGLAAPGDLRHFRAADGFAASIYRPTGAGRAVRGQGELRIRKLMTSAGGTQAEATVVSAELAGASPRDLVSARLPLPGSGVLELVGTIDAAEALAQGEARFRTAPLALGSQALA